jgi:hypothetical protein
VVQGKYGECSGDRVVQVGEGELYSGKVSGVDCEVLPMLSV